MSEFEELFKLVWHEFQHITEIINIQVQESTNLVSQAESSSKLIDRHKGLINQTRETIWRAYNNEKKLKKFYYKFDTIIRNLERSIPKVSQAYQSCMSGTNSLQLLLEDYTETQIPKFLLKLKETGNHFKIQVNKLIWREDESAEKIIQNDSNKQPKIFFSNIIQAVQCKITSFTDGCMSRKDCPKTLEHFRIVFEITALVFANLNNFSRILLYLKLYLEKFGLAISDLKALIRAKAKFYKGFDKEDKKKVTNDKIYKIIARFIKIQNFLQEQMEKLQSYEMIMPGQIAFCTSACIPIPGVFSSDDKDFTVVLQKIHAQVALVISFISSLLNQVVKKKLISKRPNTFIQERCLLFTIFHLRSILLTKMQPYTLTTNLRRNSQLLLTYLKEFNLQNPENTILSVKILNGKRHTRASISSSKHLIHSYNSSWDLQENTSNNVLDEVLEYSNFREKQRKSTVKISRTPEISPLITSNLNRNRKSSFFDKQNFEIQSAALPSLQSTALHLQHERNNKLEDEETLDFIRKMKKLRNANAGFLSHRVQRIQNNRSISPLTKIEYIREEFANNFKPVDLKLKSSLLKLKNKSTFLYTMK